MEELRNQVLEVFKSMDDSEIVAIWNQYCEDSGNCDDRIMDDFELEEYCSTMTGNDVLNFLNRFYFGQDENIEGSSANPNRNYFMFNGYGNIISFDYIYNSFSGKFNYIDVESMIDYIIEERTSYDNDEIMEILENMED